MTPTRRLYGQQVGCETSNGNDANDERSWRPFWATFPEASVEPPLDNPQLLPGLQRGTPEEVTHH